MKTRRSLRIRLLAIAMFVPLALAFDGDSHRVDSLARKLLCNCGCGEVLAECSHTKCNSRVSLKHELADAIEQGQTDGQILDLIGARHGAAILLTPAFRGFNTLLWIVPMTLGVSGLAFVLLRRLRSGRLH